ncbi:Mannose-binding lectin [Artemisia annua]|uniref:Mannose-binding lectin n=1 Tax=Artemisia annua TaxID=35608 RepID=A0A2U1NHP2_ARTAN|nr:Mannose-binding lectin [Artemisia annua]
MPEGFIEKIIIAHGGVIDSIKFQSYCNTGETQYSFFGGKGGNKTDTINIEFPKEYIVEVSGTTGNYDGYNVVKSLCIVTNKKRYGPYGTDWGTRFSYDGKGGVIVGFHGHDNIYLEAIGVYVKPESLALAQSSTCQSNSVLELCSGMSKMALPRDAGPWGASGGKPWDDGVYSAVKQVHVHIGVSLNVINAIEFEYVKSDGKTIWSHMHGGTKGDKTELVCNKVTLDSAKEYLTGISGFYGPVEGYNGLEAVTSITFYTNKKIYGPYGQEAGVGYQPFISTTSLGKVLGFHGTNNGFLSSIGVHMEYF